MRNGAAFLGEALESVRAQTRAADEVIVVDDRSTDDSVAIAEAFGATLLRTRPPGSTAAARNVGWRAASGELIAFLDADDRWRPRHLELVAPLLERAPDAVLAFGSIEFFGMLTGRYPGHVPATGAPVDARLTAPITCPVPQMTVIIPKAELDAVGGYDESLKAVEDFDLFARLSRRGRFIGEPEITGDYRQHAAQTTRFRQRQVFAENIRVRSNSVDALRTTCSPKEIAALEQRLRDLWALELRESWWNSGREEFDLTLAAHTEVPGSSRLASQWRLRRRLYWHVWSAARRYGRGFKDSRLWTPTLDAAWQRVRSYFMVSS